MNRFVTYFNVWSAAFMLAAGVALSVAGFAAWHIGDERNIQRKIQAIMRKTANSAQLNKQIRG